MENKQSVSRSQYSQLELAMFDLIGVEPHVFTHFSPPDVYKLAVEVAFIRCLKGPAVTSLRRCIVALYNGENRLTPEWDEMIQLAEPEPGPEEMEWDYDDHIGFERCKTLANVSGLTVESGRDIGDRYFMFRNGTQDVKTVYTYRKAKVFAHGVKLGRELGARNKMPNPNFPLPGN